MKSLLFSLVLMVVIAPYASAYRMVEGTLDGSEFYPRTTHTFSISVPDGYDGSPACLYVGLDGVLCNAPARIDSLIACGEIPMMVGVYIQSGKITDSDGTVLRYNRSNEFDAIDARFARFLETELLPAAIKTCAEQGIDVSLKEGGENRMIFGLSSGGIAAFVAAWHRPDMFGKVFSGCGTFVPMRGGNELQALVRKSEPRLLKVFLQDGFSDSWNPLFGSWFEGNQILGSALQFAGYDCGFDWAEGGHSLKRSNEIFDDVMCWLWQDYPSLPVSEASDNETLKHYYADNSHWNHVAPVSIVIGEKDMEQPVNALEAIYPDSTHVAVAVPGTNYLWQYLISDNGERYAGQPFYWLHNYTNSLLKVPSMAFDSLGNLWVLTDAGIQVCDQNGRVRAIYRLPMELEVGKTDDSNNNFDSCRLIITDGAVNIVSPVCSFSRPFNIHPPRSGIRPESQGQG